jgi:predicted nucleic acid-binding Zn ribbon protein
VSSHHEEPSRLYLHIVEIFKGEKRVRRPKAKPVVGSMPFDEGRDPRTLGTILDNDARSKGWAVHIARATIMDNWSSVVGEDVAAHTMPEIVDDTLAIQCDSSAWATQLRILRADIATELHNRFPDAGIQQVDVIGPGVPRQNYGPRTVKWRGPRDTYG